MGMQWPFDIVIEEKKYRAKNYLRLKSELIIVSFKFKQFII